VIAIAGLAIAIPGLALAIPGLAIAITGPALAIPGLALAIARLALAIARLALAIAGLALAIARLPLAIAQRGTARAQGTPRSLRPCGSSTAAASRNRPLPKEKWRPASESALLDPLNVVRRAKARARCSGSSPRSGVPEPRGGGTRHEVSHARYVHPESHQP